MTRNIQSFSWRYKSVRLYVIYMYVQVLQVFQLFILIAFMKELRAS
jgi:hypothetical protein